jgi:serine/threonine protein kinase
MATNKSTKARFAVKIMVKKALSESDVETLGMEVHIMRLLDHPNIVRLYDFHQVEKARV